MKLNSLSTNSALALKKKAFIFILFAFVASLGYGQDPYPDNNDCQKNVNCTYLAPYTNVWLEYERNSTVKLEFVFYNDLDPDKSKFSGCTGVLLNHQLSSTPNFERKFYILTCGHCVTYEGDANDVTDNGMLNEPPDETTIRFNWQYQGCNSPEVNLPLDYQAFYSYQDVQGFTIDNIYKLSNFEYTNEGMGLNEEWGGSLADDDFALLEVTFKNNDETTNLLAKTGYCLAGWQRDPSLLCTNDPDGTPRDLKAASVSHPGYFRTKKLHTIYETLNSTGNFFHDYNCNLLNPFYKIYRFPPAGLGQVAQAIQGGSVQKGSSGGGMWYKLLPESGPANQSALIGMVQGGKNINCANAHDFNMDTYAKFTRFGYIWDNLGLAQYLWPTGTPPMKLEPYCPDIASCFDNMQNDHKTGTVADLETGVDCGGPCAPCLTDCFDDTQNGTEEGVDCGPDCGVPCTNSVGIGDEAVPCVAISNGLKFLPVPDCFSELNQPWQVSTIVNSSCGYDVEWYTIPPGGIVSNQTENVPTSSQNWFLKETATFGVPPGIIPTGAIFPLKVGLRVKEYGSGNVFGTFEATIILDVSPFVDAGSDVDLCPGQTTSLGGYPTASQGDGFYSYVWACDPPSGLARLSSAFVANPAFSAPATGGGVYRYTLTVSDSRGCPPGKDEVVVRVNACGCNGAAGPSAFAGSDLPTCNGSAALSGSATGGAGPYTYSWSPATGLSDSHAPTPTATISATTTYTLNVTDANGCIATDAVTVNYVAGSVNPPPTLAVCGTITTNQGPLFAGEITAGGSNCTTEYKPGSAAFHYGTTKVVWKPGTIIRRGANVTAKLRPCEAPPAPPPAGRLAKPETENASNQFASDKASFSVRPNPFRNSATMSFYLPEGGPVTIDLLDALGRTLQTPVNAVYEAGAFSVPLTPGLPSGVYYLRFRTNTTVFSQKVILYE